MIVRLTLLLVLLGSPTSCAGQGCSGSGFGETYILPPGFSGPVVIVFEQSDGELLEPADDCDLRFRVPADGVLRVANPSPESGIYWRRFMVGKPDEGWVDNIGEDLASTEHQVFGFIIGGSDTRDGLRTGGISWVAFLVGIPAEIASPHRVLHEAIDRAVREILGPRSSSGLN